jgi:hypothetical protein
MRGGRHRSLRMSAKKSTRWRIPSGRIKWSPATTFTSPRPPPCGLVMPFRHDPVKFSLGIHAPGLFTRAVAHQVSSARRGLTSVFGMGYSPCKGQPVQPAALSLYSKKALDNISTCPCFPTKAVSLEQLTQEWQFIAGQRHARWPASLAHNEYKKSQDTR